MNKLMVSTAFAALAAFSLPAAAQSIVLGPTGGLGQPQPCDLISGPSPGDITVQCFASANGSASYGSATGPYTLGTIDVKKVAAVFGPTNTSGVLPATNPPVNQTFSYGPDSAGNQTVGTFTWSILDYSSALSGTYNPTATVGTPTFKASFVPGHSTPASLTLTGQFPISHLLTFGGSSQSSFAKGEIEDAPAQCKTVTTTVCN